MKKYPTIEPRPVTTGRITAYERRCLKVDSPRTFRLFFDWPRVFFQKFPFNKIELFPSQSLRYASHSLEFSDSRSGLQQLALAVMLKAGYSVTDSIAEHKAFAAVLFRWPPGKGNGLEYEVIKEGNLWRVKKVVCVTLDEGKVLRLKTG